MAAVPPPAGRLPVLPLPVNLPLDEIWQGDRWGPAGSVAGWNVDDVEKLVNSWVGSQRNVASLVYQKQFVGQRLKVCIKLNIVSSDLPLDYQVSYHKPLKCYITLDRKVSKPTACRIHLRLRKYDDNSWPPRDSFQGELKLVNNASKLSSGIQAITGDVMTDTLSVCDSEDDNAVWM